MQDNKIEEIREEFENYCNTDNFSAPPYETDIISDWWLQKLSSQRQELYEAVEKLRKEEIIGGLPRIEPRVFNEALDTVLSILKDNK